MPGVPAFILRRLYVKKSLRNEQHGFSFTLRNRLGSGYAKGMLPLSVDGAEIPLSDATFVTERETGGVETRFDEVDDNTTFSLQMNREITIRAKHAPLAAGAHRIQMGFIVPGFGKLGFDFVDEVAADPGT